MRERAMEMGFWGVVQPTVSIAGVGVRVLRIWMGVCSIGVTDKPTNDSHEEHGNDECFRDQSETDRTKFHTSDPLEHSRGQG